ncbi:MAG: methyltransferase domain-containing protein [Candidatus Aenigmarchaeota archaeon]|nr:methyltransferase domain-containing protein [Candidatus Aenigmarchaeota archaeon]
MQSGNYNEKFYSEIFEKDPDSYYNIQRDKIEKVLELFNSHHGGRILDIGCGDGFISSLIGKKTGAEMHGIDVSSSAIQKAKGSGIKAQSIDIDGKKLPFENGYFDAVFCGDVVEHIFYPDKLLEDVHRILRPGGYIIVTIPNLASWYNRAFLLFGIVPSWVESSSTYTGNPFLKESSGHIRAFTKKSLVGLLKHTNFIPGNIKGSPLVGNGSYSKRKEAIWYKIDKLFSKFPSVASTVIIKAYKQHKR